MAGTKAREQSTETAGVCCSSLVVVDLLFTFCAHPVWTGFRWCRQVPEVSSYEQLCSYSQVSGIIALDLHAERPYSYTKYLQFRRCNDRSGKASGH